MARRKGTPVGDYHEGTVDGLTLHERVAKLEGTVFGDRSRAGLEQIGDDFIERVERLESAERQRQLPWYLRLAFFRRGK